MFEKNSRGCSCSRGGAARTRCESLALSSSQQQRLGRHLHRHRRRGRRRRQQQRPKNNFSSQRSPYWWQRYGDNFLKFFGLVSRFNAPCCPDARNNFAGLRRLPRQKAPPPSRCHISTARIARCPQLALARRVRISQAWYFWARPLPGASPISGHTTCGTWNNAFPVLIMASPPGRLDSLVFLIGVTNRWNSCRFISQTQRQACLLLNHNGC